MATIPDSSTFGWTAVDVATQLGPIPTFRLIPSPTLGPATEEDVLRLNDKEDRLCELIDGLLLEKTMGTYESYLALTLGRLLGNYVAAQQLGIVLGADGLVRLRAGQVRIPDVCFISLARLPARGIAAQAIASVVPDLAVEIISRGNTAEEMNRKLRDYFAAGVREVWYIYPLTRELHRYQSVERFDVFREQDEVHCDVLPGFRWRLAELFAEPFPA